MVMNIAATSTNSQGVNMPVLAETVAGSAKMPAPIMPLRISSDAPNGVMARTSAVLPPASTVGASAIATPRIVPAVILEDGEGASMAERTRWRVG